MACSSTMYDSTMGNITISNNTMCDNTMCDNTMCDNTMCDSAADECCLPSIVIVQSTDGNVSPQCARGLLSQIGLSQAFSHVSSTYASIDTKHVSDELSGILFMPACSSIHSRSGAYYKVIALIPADRGGSCIRCCSIQPIQIA